MGSRDAAIARALGSFDDGGFKRRLTDLVAIPSTSQDPGMRRISIAIWTRPSAHGWSRWASSSNSTPIPAPASAPSSRHSGWRSDNLPTILTYGHGDTVRGLEDQWRAGLNPWVLTEEDGRWYGRGSADNKGQHAINLHALEAVLAERGGKLGFNVKMVLETAEERGSTGLREFIAEHAPALKADVLIASDGPRVASDIATISTGTRGTFHFDLVVDTRPGGVHSGNWGGMTTDPAIVLAHAIASIADRHGRILVPGLAAPGRHAGLGSRGAGRVWSCGRRARPRRSTRTGANPASPPPRRCMAGPASSCWPCSPAGRRTR